MGCLPSMDIEFDATEWQPTKPTEPGLPKLSIDIVRSLSRQLSDQTKEIRKHPYDPICWNARSETLTKLLYPELALGDAYKASLLCIGHRAVLDENPGWRLGYRMGFWMKGEASRDDGELDDLREGLTSLQSRAHKIEKRNMHHWLDSEEVRCLRRPYPWLHARHRKRSSELVEVLNEQLAQNAACQQDGLPYCVLKRHAFGGGTYGQDTGDILGVFAAIDIRKGETILIDWTDTWGCNGPGHDTEYHTFMGIRGCGDPLHPNQAEDDFSLDLRWIRDRVGKDAAGLILWCKFFLCGIRDGLPHPLDHPLIARLTPTYHEDESWTEAFQLKQDYVVPNEALRQFGVDIFANPNYDTWVLFTMQARIANNSCGDPIADCLNPLFSLFNHSCEPNVEWTSSEDHRTIRVTAGTDIEQGEQLFVDYNGFMRDQPLEVRRKHLWKWLDGPCRCSRCMREEKQQASESFGLTKAKAIQEWDVDAKPLFPEDSLSLRN